MPTSLSLSTRMAKETYLTVVMRNSVHSTSENAPKTVAGSDGMSVLPSTVLKV